MSHLVEMHSIMTIKDHRMCRMKLIFSTVLVYITYAQAVTPTDVSPACAFDVCSWKSQYCQNGGTCSLDDTCIAVCACAAGFGGATCEIQMTEAPDNMVQDTTQSSLSSSTQPAVSRCTFNLCTALEYCQNNGTCLLDEATCQARCVCKDGYTGSRCQNDIIVVLPTTTTTTATNVVRTCAFNPCTSPFSVCENNGVCEINQATCTFSCACQDGYTGNICENSLGDEESKLKPTTQETVFCTFNPCVAISDFCQNDGLCSIDSTTCIAKCTCKSGFHGKRCENTATAVNGIITTTESLTTKTKRTCAFNPCSWSMDYCKNDGTCNLDDTTCLASCTCKNGYTGSKCDKIASTGHTTITPQTTTKRICAFDMCAFFSNYCNNGGTCLLDKTTCQAKCQCTDGYTGTRCENIEKTTPISTKSPIVTTTPTGDGNQMYNVCVDGARQRTAEERVCGPAGVGIECVYGVCTAKQLTEGIWGGVEYSCDCDPGAQGTLCDARCCLNCGAHGRCVVTWSDAVEENLSEACMCDTDWQGEFCDTYSGPPSTTPEPTGIQAYNVCMADALERTSEERSCRIPSAPQCVHGVCNVTAQNEGSWTGYKYNCVCDPGAQGTFCQLQCCMDCGVHGRCLAHDVGGEGSNVTVGCKCDTRWDGELCDVYVPIPVQIEYTENTWYVWVVGVSVGVLVLLLLLAVATPYYMWKHRVILVMKIVHYFQAYEDDDEKQFDAFVSYKADEVDERFVVQVLYPKLEKELGFRLCLHFRDFVPGETISNNIINAVEDSRRTILILTPRYIESEFTRFEYQKAQEEMLKRKHRIIPIVLEDISECKPSMDKNLKGIIGAVTYLEWPESDQDLKKDKFWKRLQLSMPKTKVSESVMSEKSFGSGQTYSTGVSSNVYSDGYTSDTHDVYMEIGDVDENVSPVIRPLSEQEEDELANANYFTNKEAAKKKDEAKTDEEIINNFLNFDSNFRNNLILNVNDLKLCLTEENKPNDGNIIELCEDKQNDTVSEFTV